jgi:hypothetical protein
VVFCLHARSRVEVTLSGGQRTSSRKKKKMGGGSRKLLVFVRRIILVDVDDGRESPDLKSGDFGSSTHGPVLHVSGLKLSQGT